MEVPHKKQGARHAELPPLPLPQGITSEYIHCNPTDLTIHYLSAGTPKQPLLLLLHGYPDLAYSWRHVLVPLAKRTACYVVAPDQRGFGRTTGWQRRASSYETTDLSSFSGTNLARDLVVFIRALGYDRASCVVGHDFGAVSGSMLALMRPDMVERLVLMSHPFKQPPTSFPPNIPGDGAAAAPSSSAAGAQQNGAAAHNAAAAAETAALDGAPTQAAALAALDPPRRHYRAYNSTARAVHDWAHPAEDGSGGHGDGGDDDGLRAFFLAYLHVKSGLFGANAHASALRSRSPAEMAARLPAYYVMPANASMPAAVAELVRNSNDDPARSLAWLPESELAVYVGEWRRTGFLGGLAWYRARNDPYTVALDWALFAGREKLRMPVLFVSGVQDWGNWQEFGALEGMESGRTCEQFRGSVFIDGSGHWVQQENPERVVEEIARFVGVASK